MQELCKSFSRKINSKGLIPFFIFLIFSFTVFAEIPSVVLNSLEDTTVNLPTVVLGAGTLYCDLTGCTMSGDIDMGNNTIINANWINATYMDVFINVTNIEGLVEALGNWSADKPDYYNTTQIDDNFVNITGDTMTGDLILEENLTVSGGMGMFKGTLSERPIGYNGVRLGLQDGTPRIVFEREGLTANIDYNAGTLRFIMNTSDTYRAIMRINSTTVRIGENLHHKELIVEGNITTTEYFRGDGSQLQNVNATGGTGTDTWTGNQTDYLKSTDYILNITAVNLSMKSYVDSISFPNTWTGNQTDYLNSTDYILNITAVNISMKNYVDDIVKTIARTGDCPVGYVVMNTTTAGVECVKMSPSTVNGTIWNRSGTDVYLANTLDNVGIGTATPARKLHVLDTTDNVFAKLETDKVNGIAGLELENDAQKWLTKVETNDNFIVRDVTGNTNPFNINTGSVPSNSFVMTPTRTTINLPGNDYDFVVEGDTDAKLLFCNAGTDKVGIGTAIPSKKLEVVGDILIGGTSPKYLYFDNTAGSSITGIGHLTYDTTKDHLKIGGGSWEKITLESTEGVGIGTAGHGAELDVKGNLNVTGNITGNQIYGGAWYHNHTATELTFVDGQFYSLFFVNGTNINGFDFYDGFLSENSNLTAQIPGKYHVTYMSSGDGQNNHAYYTTIFIDDVEQDNCESHHKMSAGGDIITQSGNCFIDLIAGSEVSLRTADVGASGTGNYYSANLNLIRIGD